MKEKSSVILTISRQLGSGGAYIGQQLAKKLGISYFDREIVSQAAKKLSVLEGEVDSREEKIHSFWESFLQASPYNSPEAYIPPQFIVPTDGELFEAESEVIRRIANNQSAVIMGRCGSHVLRAHPDQVSLFLYADMAFRQARVQELYKVTAEEATKMIVRSDTARAKYHHVFTGKDWTNASQYGLCVNTGKVGVDSAVTLVLQYLEIR